MNKKNSNKIENQLLKALQDDNTSDALIIIENYFSSSIIQMVSQTLVLSEYFSINSHDTLNKVCVKLTEKLKKHAIENPNQWWEDVTYNERRFGLKNQSNNIEFLLLTKSNDIFWLDKLYSIETNDFYKEKDRCQNYEQIIMTFDNIAEMTRERKEFLDKLLKYPHIINSVNNKIKKGEYDFSFIVEPLLLNKLLKNNIKVPLSRLFSQSIKFNNQRMIEYLLNLDECKQIKGFPLTTDWWWSAVFSEREDLIKLSKKLILEMENNNKDNSNNEIHLRNNSVFSHKIVKEMTETKKMKNGYFLKHYIPSLSYLLKTGYIDHLKIISTVIKKLIKPNNHLSDEINYKQLKEKLSLIVNNMNDHDFSNFISYIGTIKDNTKKEKIIIKLLKDLPRIKQLKINKALNVNAVTKIDSKTKYSKKI